MPSPVSLSFCLCFYFLAQLLLVWNYLLGSGLLSEELVSELSELTSLISGVFAKPRLNLSFSDFRVIVGRMVNDFYSTGLFGFSIAI